jgi:hypothetical protein
MPIKCPGGGKPRYRYKKGTKVRLAFCGDGKVIEAKNTKTGRTHTPAEFARDRRGRGGRRSGR